MLGNSKYSEWLPCVILLYVCKLISQSCPSFATPWTAARQAPLSMGSSRQEYWSGLPFPSPGDLPNPRIESKSPALAGEFFTTEAPGKSCCLQNITIIFFLIWQCWAFSAAHRLSLVAESRSSSLNCGAWMSHYGGFSCCTVQVLEQVGFSSCYTWAQ